jgi:hypothetical protein
VEEAVGDGVVVSEEEENSVATDDCNERVATHEVATDERELQRLMRERLMREIERGSS